MLIPIPGLNNTENVTRVDQGEGHIRERTVDIGDTIVSVSNIGSMTLIEERRTYLLAWFGGGLALIGLGQLFAHHTIFGLTLLVVGGGFAWWWLTRKLDVFLSIGTSDGRRTNLVSKDKSFLERVRSFLRQKIDTPDIQVLGTFNLNNHVVNISTDGGGVTVGPGSIAGGRDGSVHAGGSGSSKAA